MTTFINLTQHTLSASQRADAENQGFEILDQKPDFYSELVNMTGDEDLDALAEKLLEWCRNCTCLMPIGSPAFMAVFFQLWGQARKRNRFQKTRFVFSHTMRESVDVQQPDGSVKKTVVFNHVKFLEV
jgi:hypothetical protein